MSLLLQLVGILTMMNNADKLDWTSLSFTSFYLNLGSVTFKSNCYEITAIQKQNCNYLCDLV